jgi:hypothetical protein
LENKKGFKVYEWHPCKLEGWALCFNLVFQRRIEPAFANIVPSKDDVVHGSICKISAADAEVLDKQERTYTNKIVTVKTYDGREIEAEVYVGKETASPAYVFPSKRYNYFIVRAYLQVHVAYYQGGTRGGLGGRVRWYVVLPTYLRPTQKSSSEARNASKTFRISVHDHGRASNTPW